MSAGVFEKKIIEIDIPETRICGLLIFEGFKFFILTFVTFVCVFAQFMFHYM